MTATTINWKIFPNTIDYLEALSLMEQEVQQIMINGETESVWLLEHNHVYTKGSSSSTDELINNNNIPVVEVGRGGKFTYHGPGQKIIYPLLNLNNRVKDLKKYIHDLEHWIILTLKDLGVEAHQKEGFIGVWVNNNDSEEKIAAIGVRVQKWVTSHGIALNVNPDLTKFSGIIPCGIKDFKVTSLQKLGIKVNNNQLNQLLQKNFYSIF